MKLKFLPATIILLTGFVLKAQPPEITYPGTIVYEGYYDDRSWGPLQIGFNMEFYEHPYNRFYVTSNGLVIFGSGSNDYTEDPIPSPSSPNNFIAAFWDDVVITPSGKILYTTIGASPNRKCIIQWTNMGFYSSTVLMGTFSVILYEANDEIRVQYRSIIDNTSARSHGSSASIGIENSGGTSGIRYAYHNSDAISSEQAILFTPSGSGYTMNTSAMYDGVYLTKNMNLPEPGIPKLITPSNNSITGTSQTFRWTGSSNADNYTLKISQNPDISGSIDYNTGTVSERNITGLLLNSTYYWAVFASNTTGTTWSEIYRFTTSENPPLSAVPQSVWLDQGEERTIRLQYNGGDDNLKNAEITSLPAQGSLYQYDTGIRGSQITEVPAAVTDKDLNLIYVADGGTGNGIGNFNFIISDGTGDSPESTISVNVNPPGIPNFLLAAKSGNIEIQFDKPMADPTGKEDQFEVKVNGIPVTISSVSLKPGDPYTILVTLETPLTGGETVLISYTQGDVTAESGGLLPGFTDELVSFTLQTISFPVLPEMTYLDPPVTISATASSSLPVTFTSSNTTVAVVNGHILTANSTGTAEITAFQTGDGTYAPARYIRTLTVNRADQTLVFPEPGIRTYGDPDFSAGAVSSCGLPAGYSSDDPSVAVINNGMIHITGAGTANITATQEGNNLYYPAVDVTVTLIVNKADQAIIFPAPDPVTYGDQDIEIQATASSSLEVSFDSGDTGIAVTEGTLVHILNAGTTTITASQAGNQNYNPAPDIAHLFTVNKADQTITFPQPDPVEYGEEPFSPGAYSSSGLPITYSCENPLIADVSGGLIYIKGAGETRITAGQQGNNNYNPAEEKPVDLIINKALLTITAEDKSRTYISENPPLTFVCSGFAYNDDVTALDQPPLISTTAGAGSPAGEYPITFEAGEDDRYLFSYIPGIMTITKADQTVTYTSFPAEILVNETFELDASASSGLPVSFESNNTETATVDGLTLKGLSRGTATITARQPGNENYNPAETEISVKVTSTHKNILHLFTPNNDGFNDLWEIPGLETMGKCEVRVYNRWGKLVFLSPDYHNDWDGNSDGVALPPAAYYFIIRSENEGTITGTINIVR